ncbi:DUF1345 domain-containing protein [Microbacterium sp. BK668]|uniref:DUF1345 domain-containing protein n=1 Tax=Microbacterium sp. BK668 TaxID=2512118 RepID=UPI00105D0619|nr:DUF1345 domain-containing protein [Microbacterium sp. BK668]TDN92458.1 putative membrane protein [Microbacterium sp. BK668]
MSTVPAHATVLARGIVSLAAGIAVGVWVGLVLDAWAGILAGWGAVAATSVVWVLVLVWPMDAAATRAHARSEDPGRPLARIIAVLGSCASLVAVGIVLLQTGRIAPPESYLLALIAVLAVAASWALIQVDYMLRIAAEYYSDPVGGIDFNQAEDPMYSDFAYFAFGLGMTYQVADTNVRTNRIRKLVLGQTLLAYLFGAVILATVINLVTGLG